MSNFSPALRSPSAHCARRGPCSLRAPLAGVPRWASVVLAVLAGLGCATTRAPVVVGEPLRLSEVESSDPVRRASLRLCLDGLDADAAGRTRAARSQYERAMQIDPTNPYAYLALSRRALDDGEARQALAYLDQAEALLSSEGALSPRVEAHRSGLRGAALNELGRPGDEYLERAGRLSPQVWGDGRLAATELR